MKSAPAFLKGAYCSAMRVALREADRSRDSRDIVGQTRAWKLFLLRPRLLLHRPPRGGLVPRSRLLKRFSLFATGYSAELLDHSQVCADQAAVASRRRRRRDRGDDPQRRVDRAEALVQIGELSSGRHALEGAPIAPGTEATLKALQDPLKRPPIPHDPLLDDLFDWRGPVFFLDTNLWWSIMDDSGLSLRSQSDPCLGFRSRLCLPRPRSVFAPSSSSVACGFRCLCPLALASGPSS